jgi:hypothetical protein
MELELRGEMWGSDMAGGGGGCCQKNGEESDGVRVYFWFRVFCIFLMLSKLPPICLSCGPVFIGKMLHRSQNWSLNFLSFFCKF